MDRRKVLKTTGIGFVGAGVLSGSASASKEEEPPYGRNSSDKEPPAHGRDNDCDGCKSVEILAEDDEYQITSVETEEETHIFRVAKESGAVVRPVIDQEIDHSNAEALLREDDVSITNHQDMFNRTNYWENYYDSCGGNIYSRHYSAGLSVEAGESLDDLPSGTLEAALCAAVGAKAGGAIGAAVGAVICGAIGYLFLDHIDLSGSQLTIGA